MIEFGILFAWSMSAFSLICVILVMLFGKWAKVEFSGTLLYGAITQTIIFITLWPAVWGG